MAISNIKTDAMSAGTPMTLGQYFQKLQPAPRSRDFRQARTPWTVSCRSWLQTNEAINLYCNPSSVQWSLPRRGTSVKTAAGTIRSIWRNQHRHTYYDEGEITVTFQAGNIMPVMGYYGSGIDFKNVEEVEGALAAGAIPPGLDDFYKFLSLMDAPATLGAAENRHILVYRSRVFPKLYLEGFFKDDVPITWAERADDTGNTIEWTATFQIYTSFPSFSNYAQLRDTYMSWISAEGAVEALPMGGVTAAEFSNYTAAKALSEAEPVGPPPKQGTLQVGNAKTAVTGTAPPAYPGEPDGSGAPYPPPAGFDDAVHKASGLRTGEPFRTGDNTTPDGFNDAIRSLGPTGGGSKQANTTTLNLTPGGFNVPGF